MTPRPIPKTLPEGWAAPRHAEGAARVATWDAGQSVWSLEMGGLGPGYEQCIQVCVIEILRDALGASLPTNATPEGKEALRSWGDGTISRIDKGLGGMSGAQAGAARWLAYQIASKGWEDVLRRLKARETDTARMIQASTHWPRVLEPATQGR